MHISPELAGRIENYLITWGESDVAQRVDQLEAFAIANGWPPHEGETIPELFIRMTFDLLRYLKENPQVWEGCEFDTDDSLETKMARYLDLEQRKFARAQEVLTRISALKLGPWSPAYKKLHKEYNDIMSEINHF